MKRAAAVILVVLAFCPLFAGQRTFDASSYEYRMTQTLATMAGVQLPVVTMPVSEAQLLGLLEYVPDSSLKTELVSTICAARRYSWESGAAVDPILESQAEVYLRTNRSSFDNTYDHSIMPYSERPAFFTLGAEFDFGECVTARFGLDFRMKLETKIQNTDYEWTNLFLEGGDYDQTLPHDAYVSVGGDAFSFVLGRDKVSAGDGITGNLGLSANLVFQNFAKASVLLKPFYYDMTVMTFDSADSGENTGILEVFDCDSDRQTVVIHRFSFVPAKWLTLSVYEGALQYGGNIFGDLAFLNPLMMLHGTLAFKTGHQNNFIGVEAGASPCAGIEINLQAILDQFAWFSEKNSDGTPRSNTEPNAFGFLLNVSGAFMLDGRPFTWYAEGVFTNPALYLKETDDYYNLDLIVGNSQYLDEISSDIGYMGYKYGPDSIVAAVGCGYLRSEKLQCAFDARFIVHGSNGMGQNEKLQSGAAHYYDRTPTAEYPEKRLELVASASHDVFDYLSARVQLGYLCVWNKGSVQADPVSDLQFSFGIKLDPLKLI